MLPVSCPSRKCHSPDTAGNVNLSLFRKCKRQAAGLWVMRMGELGGGYSVSGLELITGIAHAAASLLSSYWLSFTVGVLWPVLFISASRSRAWTNLEHNDSNVTCCLWQHVPKNHWLGGLPFLCTSCYHTPAVPEDLLHPRCVVTYVRFEVTATGDGSWCSDGPSATPWQRGINKMQSCHVPPMNASITTVLHFFCSLPVSGSGTSEG